MAQNKRIHVLYSGNVQGVGFRFAAERVAGRLGVTGYVKNLPDGNVEVVCEGSSQEIDEFLADMRDAMGGYISNALVHSSPARGEFSSFQIKF